MTTPATPARDALTEWTRANLTDMQRATMSKLTAAYVAECVRADRTTGARKVEHAAAIKEQFEDIVSRFSKLGAR